MIPDSVIDSAAALYVGENGEIAAGDIEADSGEAKFCLCRRQLHQSAAHNLCGRRRKELRARHQCRNIFHLP